MSVYLLRNYSTYTASTTVPVTLPDVTEAALIAQGLATAAQTTSAPAINDGPDLYITVGGNVALLPQAGFTTPSVLQGNSILPNIALGSLALTSYETNGVAQTTGTWNYSEIYVPYWNTWKGIGVLNGTTVTSNKYTVALFGSNGVLLANSAPAGVTTATASVMQNVSFVNPILLPPGRYFLAVQLDGNTDTVRHVLSANGSNVICGTQTGTATVIPATITTISTTFTTAVAPICQLFTV
jgi:hypothetical protein